MELILVLRALDPYDPIAVCMTAGALPAEMIFRAWEAMERMKEEALLLPPYAPGTDPKHACQNRLIGLKEQ